MTVTILVGDVREKLRTLASDSVHCIVTSPPYWGLRDYGVDGQIGLESSPAEFIATMVDVFEELRRVLRPDGTCWMNMGDSYAGGRRGPDVGSGLEGSRDAQAQSRMAQTKMTESRRRDNAMIPRSDVCAPGLKPKDLLMMPHRLAIALQDAGWWVRQDIVWSKPNPMPESVRDRCTKSHEYIFLLTKSERYYFDQDAVRDPWEGEAAAAVALGSKVVGQRGINPSTRRGLADGQATQFKKQGHSGYFGADGKCLLNPLGANKRSVWTMATQSFKDAHFATFPTELPETCIKAGCPPGGTVLDPFFGAGTTGLVADRLQRNCIGIELNPMYAEMARRRIHGESTLFAEIEVTA